VTVAPRSDTELDLKWDATAASGKPVEGHLTLLPDLRLPVRLSSGGEIRLGEKRVEISSPEWIGHAGWRLTVPPGARVIWPARPHNPYRKGGEARISEARLVVALPFSAEVRRYELTLRIM
jgi:hypothetical protein